MDKNSKINIDTISIAMIMRKSTNVFISKNDVHEINSTNKNYRLFVADYSDKTKSITVLCRISIKTHKSIISCNTWSNNDDNPTDKYFFVSKKTIAKAMSKLTNCTINEQKVHRLDSSSKKHNIFYANYTNKEKNFTLICRVNNATKKTQISMNNWHTKK